MLLMEHFNTRIRQDSDIIIGDPSQINKVDASNLLPEYYEVVLYGQGKTLLELCVVSSLRMLNGR